MSIRKVRVGGEERERVPLGECVADRLAHRALREVLPALSVEPRSEVFHHGAAHPLAHLEVLGAAEQIASRAARSIL